MISRTRKEITDCLLGKYDTEKESEILADCFSTDENAADYELVREDLIETYLSEKLSNEDRKRFEDHFLKNPYHRELIGFARALRGCLGENKQLAEAAAPEKKPFALGQLLVPVGSLAAIAIISLLIWQAVSKNERNQIAQTNASPTPAGVNAPQTSPVVTAPTGENSLPNTNSGLRTNSATNKANEIPANKNAAPPVSDRTEQRNPVLAFSLPMGLKGGEEILKINRYSRMVRLETTIKPEKEFPRYNIKIIELSGAKRIVLERDFESFPKYITVPAGSLKDGDYQFIVIGIAANGEREELKGIESRFTIEVATK